VLRLVVPAPPVVLRFALRAAPAPLAAPDVPITLRAAPVPLAAPTGVPIATTVGILATSGTRVSMTPADLTMPGRVDITEFHVAIRAGVW
jgi:hypothetical protein